MIFLRINLPNFMYFEVYQTWTEGDGNCFLSGPIILQECIIISLVLTFAEMLFKRNEDIEDVM